MSEKSTQSKSAKTKSSGLYTSDDLLKIGETAKALGVSVATIRKWCDQGLLTPIVSESGHRLFKLKEVLHMKVETNKEPVVSDYVLKAKQMRETKREKFELLKHELKKFNGAVTGITLLVKEKVYLNQDDDSIRPWLVVENDGHTIFLANHSEGEIFEFKTIPHLYPASKYIPGFADIALGGILKEGKTVITDKVSGVKKGTLHDLFDAVSKQIANL